MAKKAAYQGNARPYDGLGPLRRTVSLACAFALLASCATARVDLQESAYDVPASAALVPCREATDQHGRPFFAPLASLPEEGAYKMVAFRDKVPLSSYDIEIINDKSRNPLKPFGYLGGAILLAVPVGIIVGFSFMCTEDPDDPDAEDCDAHDRDDQFRTGFAVGVVGTLAWGLYVFVDESRKLFSNDTEVVRARTNFRYDGLGRLSHMMVTPFGQSGAFRSTRFLYNGNSREPYDSESYSYNTDPPAAPADEMRTGPAEEQAPGGVREDSRPMPEPAEEVEKDDNGAMELFRPSR